MESKDNTKYNEESSKKKSEWRNGERLNKVQTAVEQRPQYQ